MSRADAGWPTQDASPAQRKEQRHVRRQLAGREGEPSRDGERGEDGSQGVTARDEVEGEESEVAGCQHTATARMTAWARVACDVGVGAVPNVSMQPLCQIVRVSEPLTVRLTA